MKLNRPSARTSANNKRFARNEYLQAPNQAPNQGAHEERKEHPFSFRGNVVQDVWQVTQRKVKLLKPGSGQRQRDAVDEDISSDAKEPLLTMMKRSHSRRNMGCDGKKQFQYVMDELKSRTKARIDAKEHCSEPNKGSPTRIQSIAFADADQEDNDNSSQEGTAGSTDGESSLNGKNWLAKAGKLPKGIPNILNRQLGQSHSFQFRPDSSQNFGPKPGVQIAISRNDICDTENSRNTSPVGRRLFRFGVDQSAIQRKGARVAFPFKRKNPIGTLQKSKSIGVLTVRARDLFENECFVQQDEHRKSSDPLLDIQVQQLLISLSKCEQKLMKVRQAADRNRAELGSEVDRLNGIIFSFASTQELQYRSLLDGLNENARNLGHVESSFDNFSALLNRLSRSTAQHQLKKVTFVLVNIINVILLAVVYAITRIYYFIRMAHRWWCTGPQLT